MRAAPFALLTLLGPCRAAAAGVTALQPPGKSLVPRADVSACKLTSSRSADSGLGFRSRANCAPSTGSLNALMLFVDFPDFPAQETTQNLYDFFLPQAADWYRNASYGRLRLNVTADMSGFYRMPARADSYNWSRGLTTAMHLKYIQDALGAYNRTVAGLDELYIVVPRRTSAITTSFTSSVEIRSKSGTRIARTATTFGTTLFTSWGYKTMNHETGHAMCMPDLYELSSGQGGVYTGGFDLMGPIGGPGPDFFAWNKWLLGWIDDDQVECVSGPGSTTHSLTPLGVTGGVKAVVVKKNATSVLVAELRTAIGLDAKLCAPGVLLYTVSTTVASGKGPIRVVDTTPSSRGCAGEKLNDAALPLKAPGSPFAVPGWGVNVTVTDQTAGPVTIRVDVA